MGLLVHILPLVIKELVKNESVSGKPFPAKEVKITHVWTNLKSP